MIVAGCEEGKRFFPQLVFLIVAARHLIGGFDCRAGWRSAGAAFSLDGGLAPVPLDINLEDEGVMDEAVDGGERHRLVSEH